MPAAKKPQACFLEGSAMMKNSSSQVEAVQHADQDEPSPGSSPTCPVMEIIAAWELAREHGQPFNLEAMCHGDEELAQQVVRGLHRLGYRPEPAPPSKQEDLPEASKSTHPDQVVPEQLVGPYRIKRVLGQGGMGVVYAALDPTLDREIALKMMKPEMTSSPHARARFMREARSAAAVTHDHILPILHVGEHRGCPFLAMPLLSGETLFERLRRGPLTEPELNRLCHEAASGLAAAHAAGLVHRDIKPSNLWLEHMDETSWRVKVFDFGLARALDSSDQLSLSHLPMGTPAYMSPEQVNGQSLDGRSDLFSLGVVLYQAAAGGMSPFRRDSLTSMLRAIAEFAPSPLQEVRPDLSPSFVSLIHRMLEKNRDQRPSTAREVADLTDPNGQPEGDVAKTAIGLSKTTKHDRKWLSSGAMLIGLLMVAGLLAILFWATGLLTNQKGQAASKAQSTRTGSLEPLRVTSIDVNHIEVLNDKNEGSAKGLLGKKSFAARLGDHVTIQVQLSRPAYSYLIAYRPDGVVELCYPEDPEEVPVLSDQPRYPSKSRGVNYGLTEGTGLWVIGVIASEQPLPSYREWINKHGAMPWQPEKVEPGTVWLDDGQWVESISQAGVVRGERGAGAKVPGKSTVVKITDVLKARAEHATAAAIGFGVSAR